MSNECRFRLLSSERRVSSDAAYINEGIGMNGVVSLATKGGPPALPGRQ